MSTEINPAFGEVLHLKSHEPFLLTLAKFRRLWHLYWKRENYFFPNSEKIYTCWEQLAFQ